MYVGRAGAVLVPPLLVHQIRVGLPLRPHRLRDGASLRQLNRIEDDAAERAYLLLRGQLGLDERREDPLHAAAHIPQLLLALVDVVLLAAALLAAALLAHVADLAADLDRVRHLEHTHA